MKSLYQQTTEWLQGIGDEQMIADHFGIKKQAVVLWFRKKQYPQKVFEAYYAWCQEQMQEKPEQAELETGTGTTGTNAQSVSFDTNGQTEDAIGSRTDQRLNQIEGVMQDIINLLQNQQEQGPNVPHSAVRPPNRANSAMAAAGIINPGIGSGIAPTRDQAHRSAEGSSGRPAGPAQAREPIKPGDPGWNGRVYDEKGNIIKKGWNDAAAKPQMVAMWPSPR
jgi:hypothetical protein